MEYKKESMCKTCIHRNTSFKIEDEMFSRFYKPGEIGDADGIECSTVMRIRAMSNIMFGDYDRIWCLLYEKREKETCESREEQ